MVAANQHYETLKTWLTGQDRAEEAVDGELFVVDHFDGSTASDRRRGRQVGWKINFEAALLAPQVALQLDVVGGVAVEVVADHRREPNFWVVKFAIGGAFSVLVIFAFDEMQRDAKIDGRFFLPKMFTVYFIARQK